MTTCYTEWNNIVSRRSFLKHTYAIYAKTKNKVIGFLYKLQISIFGNTFKNSRKQQENFTNCTKIFAVCEQ